MTELLLIALTSLMISTAAPKLPDNKVYSYAKLIVKHSQEHGLKPKTVVAVAWHESGFRNLDRNSTNDYGVLQVHWYPGSPWLKGLTRTDLLDPKKNIKAGVHELAWWKRFHETRCKHPDSHYFWSHYKWGVRIKNRKYGKAVMKKREILRAALVKENL